MKSYLFIFFCFRVGLVFWLYRYSVLKFLFDHQLISYLWLFYLHIEYLISLYFSSPIFMISIIFSLYTSKSFLFIILLFSKRNLTIPYHLLLSTPIHSLISPVLFQFINHTILENICLFFPHIIFSLIQYLFPFHIELTQLFCHWLLVRLRVRLFDDLNRLLILIVILI